MKKIISNIIWFAFGIIFTTSIIFYCLQFYFDGSSFSYDNVVKRPGYNFRSNSIKNNPFIQEVVDYCYPFEYEKQVECVVKKVDFKYKDRNSTETTPFKSPEYVYLEGGICRDVAVIYDSIFRQLNWTTDYTIIPNHVYNFVSKEKPNGNYVTCHIDMKEWKCF